MNTGLSGMDNAALLGGFGFFFLNLFTLFTFLLNRFNYKSVLIEKLYYDRSEKKAEVDDEEQNKKDSGLLTRRIPFKYGFIDYLKQYSCKKKTS